MGIDLAQYRCRIGLFSASTSCTSKHASKSSQPHSGSYGLTFRLVPAAALCLLLIIAGIELNPGPPSYNCKYCDLSFTSIAQYAKHIIIHKLRKNFNIPCPYCDRQLKLKSLESHISRFHRSARLRPQVQHIEAVKCSECRTELSTRKDYVDHMYSHLKDGVNIKCTLVNCNSVFSCKRKFQKHMSRCHAGVTDYFDPPTVAVSECGFSDDEQSDGEENDENNDEGRENYFDCTEGIAEDFDPYPYSTIKNELAKFYLKLEGELCLPTSTVQLISEEIKLISELSHHRLKIALKQELESFHIDPLIVSSVIKQAFKADPVFNVHHKSEDVEQLCTHYLRRKYWEKYFPYVEPEEHYFGLNAFGKKRIAHTISIKETLKLLLKNPKFKEMLLKSFTVEEEESSVKKDYKDGEAHKKHKCQHNGGKCIQLNLFQDAFEFNAFGAASTLYKTLGFYYVVGNMDAESRSKVDLIQIAGLILESDLKPTQQEELDGKDILKEAIQPILDQLIDLKENGIEVDGETIPVCLCLLIGDSLGQHTVGGYVKSFSCEFFCRFCPISRTEFHLNPSEVKPFRTIEEYDDAVKIANRKWQQRRKEALSSAKRATLRKARRVAERVASRCSAPAKKSMIKTLITKDAFQKLCAISFRAVKYRPSPFNSIPGFHCSLSQPVCIAHDLFEGVLKCVLPCIMQYCISKKEWFDLPTLNRRIRSFKCVGSDAKDRPKPFKTIDQLSGHAVENWNTLRLLPLIIGDLIEDQNDEVWQVFLNLKEIVEYVCAPKISMSQVAYLKQLIRTFANSLKRLNNHFPKCIIPKVHFLCHYSDLIDIFGPLIRLFTLRFESVHMFFKTVVRNSKSYINITKTMAQKYMLRFASHNSSDLFPPDIVYDPATSRCINMKSFPDEKKSALPNNFNPSHYEVLDVIQIKGTEYNVGFYVVLSSSRDSTSLQVGRIDSILLDSSNCVRFLLESMEACNSFQGYYIVTPSNDFQLLRYEELADYYPLPSYIVCGKECISLHHSICDEI